VYVAPVTNENLNALRLLEGRNRAVARAEGLAAIITYTLGQLDAAAAKGDPDPLADEIRRRVKEVLG
jgi:hypothetical protein